MAYNYADMKIKFSQNFKENEGKKVKVDVVRQKLGVIDDKSTTGKGFRTLMVQHLGKKNITTGSTNGYPVLLGYEDISEDLDNTDDNLMPEDHEPEDPLLSIRPSDSISQVQSHTNSCTQSRALSPRFSSKFRPVMSTVQSNFSRNHQSVVSRLDDSSFTVEELFKQSQQLQNNDDLLKIKEQYVQLQSQFEALKETHIGQKQELITAKQDIIYLRSKLDTKKQEYQNSIKALKVELRQDYKEEIESMKSQYSLEIESMRSQHSLDKQTRTDEFNKLRSEFLTKRDDFQRRQEEFIAYKNMSISDTNAIKLRDSQARGHSVGFEQIIKPSIFREVRPGKSNKNHENLD